MNLEKRIELLEKRVAELEGRVQEQPSVEDVIEETLMKLNQELKILLCSV